MKADTWTFPAVIDAAGSAFPDEPALLHGDRSLTWQELTARSTAIARHLRATGIEPGAAVAQYLPNGPEYIESLLAALRVRLVPMNTNYRYIDDELRYIWEDAGVLCVVFHSDFWEHIQRLRPSMSDITCWIETGSPADATHDGVVAYERWTTEDATAPLPRGDEHDLLLLYTGGTTGPPKGVMWRQGDLLSLLNSMSHRALPDHGSPADVARHVEELGPGSPVLVACPLMHGTGLFHALIALSTGSPVVTLDSSRFDATVLLDAIDSHAVGSIVIVGDAFARPIVQALEEAPRRWHLSSLRVVFSSGAMLSKAVKERLLQLVPRLRVVDALGSSEASGLGSSVSSSDDIGDTASFRLGTNAGILIDDGTWAQPGDGRRGLLATTGWLPLGYWNDPVKTAEVFREIDGRRWAVPGDYATLDSQGFVQLLGRGTGCINTAGEKVYPEEVEEALKLHPAITDAAVVGAPDPRFGEVVVAFVETEEAELDVREFARQHLAAYKIPKLTIPVQTVGRSASGKLDLRTLRADAAGRWQTNG